ncbi:MAG: lysophospholipid acyltransferase family protein [Candidatus Eiseniibacteriota bacterium]
MSARTAWLAVRSSALWALSALHFFGGGALLVALGAVVAPRRFDPLVRLFMRNQVRLAGARLTVVRSPEFDPERTSVFVCNHVSIFDPFVLYSAIPQFVRGLELESHFRVPVYGWMMRNFGNVPVPVERSAPELRRMRGRCRAALASGTSLLVFPEGHRTRDGRVGRFHLGAFRMAREVGVPIVPVTQVGAWQLKRVGSWWLHPTTIVVHVHAPIETAGLGRDDDAALCAKAHAVVAGPIH